MKKVAVIGLFALVAGILSVSLVASSGATVTETTLTYTSRPGNETSIDVNGNHELDPADGWVSNGQLLQGDVVVGRTVTSVQYMTVRADGMGGVIQMVATASIDGSQLTIQGRWRLIEGATTVPDFAITGGTGAFAGATGYVETVPVPGSMDSTITVHLFT